MEKVVYLILSRDKDRFDIIYVGDCEKTDDKAFFVENSHYKCWLDNSLSEKSLHLAILPLFDSDAEHRQNAQRNAQYEVPKQRADYAKRYCGHDD